MHCSNLLSYMKNVHDNFPEISDWLLLLNRIMFYTPYSPTIINTFVDFCCTCFLRCYGWVAEFGSTPAGAPGGTFYGRHQWQHRQYWQHQWRNKGEWQHNLQAKLAFCHLGLCKLKQSGSSSLYIAISSVVFKWTTFWKWIANERKKSPVVNGMLCPFKRLFDPVKASSFLWHPCSLSLDSIWLPHVVL